MLHALFQLRLRTINVQKRLTIQGKAQDSLAGNAVALNCISGGLPMAFFSPIRWKGRRISCRRLVATVSNLNGMFFDHRQVAIKVIQAALAIKRSLRGCHPHWHERLDFRGLASVPSKKCRTKWLNHYASVFNTVEVNSTFWHPQNHRQSGRPERRRLTLSLP